MPQAPPQTAPVLGLSSVMQRGHWSSSLGTSHPPLVYPAEEPCSPIPIPTGEDVWLGQVSPAAAGCVPAYRPCRNLPDEFHDSVSGHGLSWSGWSFCVSLTQGKVGVYMNIQKWTHKEGSRQQERGLPSLCDALVWRRVNICEGVPKPGPETDPCETHTGQRWVSGIFIIDNLTEFLSLFLLFPSSGLSQWLSTLTAHQKHSGA